MSKTEDKKLYPFEETVKILNEPSSFIDATCASYWNERYSNKEFVWTVSPNQFLVNEINGLATGNVLELASGEGRNSVWLAQQGFKVDAVDFSISAIKKAKSLAEMTALFPLRVGR